MVLPCSARVTRRSLHDRSCEPQRARTGARILMPSKKHSLGARRNDLGGHRRRCKPAISGEKSCPFGAAHRRLMHLQRTERLMLGP
jgi:hypothetical protein